MRIRINQVEGLPKPTEEDIGKSLTYMGIEAYEWSRGNAGITLNEGDLRYAAISHEHEITQVVGLEAALLGKADTASLADHLGAENPHDITAETVGNDTPQWNANQLWGYPLSNVPPAAGQALVWDAVSEHWEPGAPVDAAGRAETALKVNKAGDTMTGMLTLPDTVPSANLHATSKVYVDGAITTAIAGVSGSANSRVLKAGDTMTGDLQLAPADAMNAEVGITTTGNATATFRLSTAASRFAQLVLQTLGVNRWVLRKGNLPESGSNAGSDLELLRYTDAGSGVVNATVKRSDGSLTWDPSISATSILGRQTVMCTPLASGDAIVEARAIGAATQANLVVSAPAACGAGVRFRTGTGSTGDRWTITKSTDGEVGGNAGSDLQIFRHADGGSSATAAMVIRRNTGNIECAGTVSAGRVESGSYVTTPGAILNNSAGLGLSVNGFQSLPSSVFVCYFGQADPNLGSSISVQAVHQLNVYTAVRLTTQGQVFDFRGDGQAYKAVAGDWAAISDERVKNLKRPYTLGLSFVLALDPWVYTLKPELGRGDTQEYVSATAQNVEAAGDEGHMVKSQRLLEGTLDIADCRVLDTSAMQWAFVNSLKELNAKHEALAAEFEAYKLAHP